MYASPSRTTSPEAKPHREEPAPIFPKSNQHKRAPTPFHHSIPLPIDEEETPSYGMTGLVVPTSHTDVSPTGPTASDSGISVNPSSGPAIENGHTIYLDERPGSRKSITSGASLHPSVSTPKQSSTGDEYSYPDPFVAKVALKTLRKLNPSHRSVEGRRSTDDLLLVEAERRESSASAYGIAEDDQGYGTDSSEKRKQRQLDNATVIPAPSSESTARRRSRPLHREMSAGKLRPALRGVHAREGDATDVVVETSRVQSPAVQQRGQGISVSLTHDSLRHRKPLPAPPPLPPSRPGNDFERSGHTSGVGSSGVGWNGQNLPSVRESGSRAFSIRALRQSLPAIGINLQSSRNRNPVQRPMIRHPSELAQVPTLHPYGHRQAPQNAGYIQPEHTPVSASIPFLEGLLPSTGNAAPHSQHDRRKNHPADNLGLYLRLASLPKWDKWIDPDVKTSSRWHNRSNWGTGRARSGSKSRHGSLGPAGSKDKYSVITSSAENPEEESSGRKRTIDRLVQGVTKHEDKARMAGQEPAWTPPPTSGPDGLGLGDESADKPARYLRSWEARRRFLDAIENCEYSTATLCQIPWNVLRPRSYAQVIRSILPSCLPLATCPLEIYATP